MWLLAEFEAQPGLLEQPPEGHRLLSRVPLSEVQGMAAVLLAVQPGAVQ